MSSGLHLESDSGYYPEKEQQRMLLSHPNQHQQKIT